MKDQSKNQIFVTVFASGKPVKAHLLAVTSLSNETVAKSINKIIKENKIAYKDIIVPRNKSSYKSSMKTKHMIEEKMEEIGIEIYIYGFLIPTGVGEEQC